jgi:hypothetical protein
MQDQRFARSAPDWTGQVRPRQPLSSLAPRDRYLRDWKLVKRGKQSASAIAFALAGIVGFLFPIYALVFREALTVHSKNVLDFTAFVMGGLSLMLGLIEQAKDYPAKARRFDHCGRRVNRVLRRLTITPTTCDADLEPLIDEYEKALDECGENHDDIDQDIAKAQEKLDKASSEIEETKAEKKICPTPGSLPMRGSLLPIFRLAGVRGVRFAMLCGPTLVAVVVTHAALDNIDPPTPGAGGHLECFNKHRDAIEKIASGKHERHQLEEGGVVIVEAGDLKLISG